MKRESVDNRLFLFGGEKVKDLEKRSFSFEVRAEETEEGNIITGRPIVYDTRTDIGCYDELIERGALDRTDLTDVRFLVNHDFSRIPLARSRRNNGNSTMFLSVDDLLSVGYTDSDDKRIRNIVSVEKIEE